MATYYKYAEREADSYVNWAEIGKNMSDMLANENKVREEKKAAIDEESRQIGLTLSNPPQGESTSANEYILKFAGDAQSQRLMNLKLLKSGKMKLNDYLISQQNLVDGTNSSFALMKEYQEEYTNKMERMKGTDPKNSSQDLESFFMGEAEGFGNFNQTQLYIDPTSGKVSVAYKEKGEDGVYRINPDPNKFTDINALRNRIKAKFDLYDVNGNMESYVNGLGTEIDSFVSAKNSLGATGTISEVLDITRRKNLPKDMQGVVMKFEEAETKMLQSQLSNPYNTSSVLTNSLNVCSKNGKEYTFTWDAEDAKKNPEKILLTNKSNGTPLPKFSEDQEKDALEYLRLQARMRYDKKTEMKTTAQLQLQERRAPAQTEVDRSEKQADAKTLAQNLAWTLTGSDSEAQNAMKYLAGQGITIKRDKDNINVTTNKGTVSYKLADIEPGKLMTSIIGSANPADLPQDMVVKYGKQFTSGKKMNRATVGQGFEAEKAPADPMAQYGSHVSSVVGTISTDEEKAYDDLNAKLNSLGASARIPYTVGDYIVVKAPNGKESAEINLKRADASQQIADFLKSNPKGATGVEQQQWVKGLKSTGVIKGGGGELD